MASIDSSVKQIALAQPQRPQTGLLGSVARFLRDFRHTIFDTYHPEAHYMRGPGPACAAKRASRT